MEFDPSRLRRGELIVGAGALVLLALTFFVKWDRDRGGHPLNGWHALTHVRWLTLLTVLLGLSLTLAQAARRAPAVPVSLSVIVTVLALITSAWLAYRVVINPLPDQKLGAVLSLISACGIAVGGYLSMRQEGIATRDGPGEIPTVRLGSR